MDTLDKVIDKASEICGSQNKLAERLGTTSGALSSAKGGKRSMPEHQIRALATIVGLPAADLWLIAQDARNPFKHTAPGVLASLLAAVIAGVLSLVPSAETQAATSTYSGVRGTGGMHIVTCIKAEQARHNGSL